MAFYPASETDKQEVLEFAKEHLTIEDAKKILEKNGYFVANLWHVDDVTAWAYECDEDTAQDVLYKALTNEYVMDIIWQAIDASAEELNIERK
jgi:hypothetical protein